MRTMVLAVSAALLSLTVAMPARADVSIGINIGVPAPPPVIVAPPQLVIVPGTSVHYVSNAGFNVFVYGGKAYSHHNGAWFVAPSPRGPWATVVEHRVPGAVRGVPATYYKIPPGHARKMGGEPGGPPGHAKGPKGKKGRD